MLRHLRPHVTGTAVTFEREPPTEAQTAGRIAAAQRAHAWLVRTDDGVVVGYAHAGPYKERAAYRWSYEVSVYLDGGRRRRGGGRALYEALFARLAERGFRTAVAGMTLPDVPGVGLHTALGFEPIGTFLRIGHEHGQWGRDVLCMQRAIGPCDDDPADPS